MRRALRASRWGLCPRFEQPTGLDLAFPGIAHLDLADHDIPRARGLYDLLEEQRVADRVSHDCAIVEARSVPPQTTRVVRGGG